MSKEPKPTFDPEYVRDISEQAYRIRLEQDCPGNVERMLGKDNDGGVKLRNRAASYDPLTRAYLKVLGFEPTSTHTSTHRATPAARDIETEHFYYDAATRTLTEK